MPGLYGAYDIVVAAIGRRMIFGMTALESIVYGAPIVIFMVILAFRSYVME